MKILLDTHTFLWWIENNPQLSHRARAAIGDANNQVFLSAASGWEIAIKAQVGKLELPDVPMRFVPAQLSLNAMDSLPILLSHVLHVYSLPMHHRDPFDRILVAQSQMENIPILTTDPLIAQYAVSIIW